MKGQNKERGFCVVLSNNVSGHDKGGHCKKIFSPTYAVGDIGGEIPSFSTVPFKKKVG